MLWPCVFSGKRRIPWPSGNGAHIGRGHNIPLEMDAASSRLREHMNFLTLIGPRDFPLKCHPYMGMLLKGDKNPWKTLFDPP